MLRLRWLVPDVVTLEWHEKVADVHFAKAPAPTRHRSGPIAAAIPKCTPSRPTRKLPTTSRPEASATQSNLRQPEDLGKRTAAPNVAGKLLMSLTLEAFLTVRRHHNSSLPNSTIAALQGSLGPGVQLQGWDTARQLGRLQSAATASVLHVVGVLGDVDGGHCATFKVSVGVFAEHRVIDNDKAASAPLRKNLSKHDPPCRTSAIETSLRAANPADTSHPNIRMLVTPAIAVTLDATFAHDDLRISTTFKIDMIGPGETTPVKASPLTKCHTVARVGHHAFSTRPLSVVTIPLVDGVGDRNMLSVGVSHAPSSEGHQDCHGRGALSPTNPCHGAS